MSLKLYELAEAYKNIQAMLEDEETDIALVEDALKTVEGAIETKAGNIAILIKSLDAEAKLIKEEEDRLKARRQAVENRRDRIKEFLQSALEQMGIDKVRTATHTISIQNNPPAVQIIDENAIPGKFLTLIPEHYEVNKRAILEAAKAGEEIPGVWLTRGRSLRIR